MVTVLMAILVFMGIGWQFAFEQWGSFLSVDNASFIILPISATPIQVVVVDMASAANSLCMSTLDYTNGKFKVTGNRNDLSYTQLWGHWIAVCN